MATEEAGAEPWVPDRLSRTRLLTAVEGCRGCDLFRDATQAVMGAGRLKAPLMLVGEQPGDHEDRAGKPFVGPAGRVLGSALEAAGIDPRDVFATNVVKHFRFSTRGKQRIHQTPNRTQVVSCLPWLQAELDLVRPRGLVLLGSTAGQGVFGASFRVGQRRGQVMDWPDSFVVRGRPGWVVATTHPSAVLRAKDRAAVFDGLVQDLGVAARMLADAAPA